MVEISSPVGLIVNPAAGKSSARIADVVPKLVTEFAATTVLTGPGALGAAVLSTWNGQTVGHDFPNDNTRETTEALARWIVGHRPSVLIVVGGDGTLSDVAQVCATSGARVPILGVGAGSTNVGNLVTCKLERVADVKVRDLETWSPPCLSATVNGQDVALAFNDVVIGYTVVGTVNGVRTDLDAAQRMQGRIIHRKPRGIGGGETRVVKRTPQSTHTVGAGRRVGAVVAGFAEPSFIGKAISGGVCLSALAGLPAGCVVSNVPLVRVGMTPQEIQDAPPLTTKYVSLSDDAEILVRSVNPGAVLCVDGNPVRCLTSADCVQIRVRREAVVAFRSKNREIR